VATKRISRKHRSSSDKFLRFIPTDKGRVPNQLIAKHFPYAADAEWRYRVTVESSKMQYPEVVTYAKDGDHMLRIAQELIKGGVAKHEIFYTAEHRDDYSGEKAKIPTAKVLRFTPTGKSVPVPAQEIADDQLLQAAFPHMIIDPELRGLHLATIKGGDEGAQKYLRRQFPGDYPPSAS